MHSFFKKKKQITLRQIIGGLTRSLLQAQQASASHMLELMENLTYKENGVLKPKYFTFGDKDKTYRLPLLTLMPVTHMSIDQAEIDFDVNMYEIVKDDLSAEHQEDIAKINVEYDPVKIHAELNENKSNLHVKIKFKNDILPTGLSQYMNSLTNLENSEEVK